MNNKPLFREEGRKAIGIVFAAIMLITIFAVTVPIAAAQITVDGNESDWIGLAGVKCIADPAYDITGPTMPYDGGYDITKVCAFYDSLNDTVYFKFNVTGVPGDADGDGDPNNMTIATRAMFDYFEVGSGENYVVTLDVTGDSIIDWIMKYDNNTLSISDPPETTFLTGTLQKSIGPPYTNDTVVEMGYSPAHNMTGFGSCANFTLIEARCGSAWDYISEDNTSALLLNAAPVPIPDGDDVCLCTNTTLDGSASYDPDGTIVWWHWDFGDGNTSSGAAMSTTSHHYGAPGTYTVNLTVTDDYGFVCSNTTNVMVYGNPTADFTVTTEFFCTDTQFTDTSIPAAGAAIVAWNWDFGDGNTSTVQNPTNHYPTPGSYMAKLNVTDENGCTDEIEKPVTVRGEPTPTPTPPPQVPVLMPIGIIALLGLLLVVAVMSIMKGRK